MHESVRVCVPLFNKEICEIDSMGYLLFYACFLGIKAQTKSLFLISLSCPNMNWTH